MPLYAKEHVVREGTFLYAAEVQCRIRIVQSPVLYGTGDVEDEPDASEDQETECFYIEYGSTTDPNMFVARSQPYLSLQAALHGAIQQLGSHAYVRWSNGASEA